MSLLKGKTIVSLSVGLLFCAISSEVKAAVIYDNTTTPIDGLTFSALQQGDEIEAAGEARIVTELLIGVSQQGVAGTADLQARLYANDGPGGEPGSLLWESPLMNDVALTGNVELISFPVPWVAVPNIFTWTIQTSDATPVAVGLPFFNPPTVGSSPDYSWFGSPGSWGRLFPSSPDLPQNYMARVIAVSTPEPTSVLGLLSIGALGIGSVFLRRRK
jgi:hypothetical protein